MFNTTGPHFCPVCPARVRKTRRFPDGIRVGEVLELTESNYSGCGVDMANCEKCGRGFCISYKVDKIERAKDRDTEGVESGVSVTINRETP